MSQGLQVPPIGTPFLDPQGYVTREWYLAITRSFGLAQGTADKGVADAATAQGAAEAADSKAVVAQQGVDALKPVEYVVTAGSLVVENARLLTGDTGLDIDTSTPNIVHLVLDVIAALGYTPVDPGQPVVLADTLDVAGAATLAAGLTVTGLTETDTLRINTAPVTAATAQVGYVMINLNGVNTKVLTG